MNTISFITLPQGPELWIILGILVLFFGANKIPKLMSGIGQGISQFTVGLQRGKNIAEKEMNNMKKELEEEQAKGAALISNSDD